MRSIVWSITNIKRDQDNVVKVISWSCDGVDGEASNKVHGHEDIKLGDFNTDFATVTEQEILDYVWKEHASNGLSGKDIIESIVDYRLDHPEYAGLIDGLPW